jgi:hypothetical protein
MVRKSEAFFRSGPTRANMLEVTLSFMGKPGGWSYCPKGKSIHPGQTPRLGSGGAGSVQPAPPMGGRARSGPVRTSAAPQVPRHLRHGPQFHGWEAHWNHQVAPSSRS